MSPSGSIKYSARLMSLVPYPVRSVITEGIPPFAAIGC